MGAMILPKTFSEAEYKADPRRVVEYAIAFGAATVLRADGTIRIVISVPPAELTASSR
jgi:hypothetical protein